MYKGYILCGLSEAEWQPESVKSLSLLRGAIEKMASLNELRRQEIISLGGLALHLFC